MTGPQDLRSDGYTLTNQKLTSSPAQMKSTAYLRYNIDADPIFQSLQNTGVCFQEAEDGIREGRKASAGGNAAVKAPKQSGMGAQGRATRRGPRTWPSVLDTRRASPVREQHFPGSACACLGRGFGEASSGSGLQETLLSTLKNETLQNF